MKLTVASVASRKSGSKSDPAQLLFHSYVDRASRLAPTDSAVFPNEAALLAAAQQDPARAHARPAAILLFDPLGDPFTSPALAALLGRLRDDATPRIFFAIGPADGWTPAAASRAHRVISLGPITLPHELARIVVAEQLYRALTILAGHPYHCGH